MPLLRSPNKSIDMAEHGPRPGPSRELFANEYNDDTPPLLFCDDTTSLSSTRPATPTILTPMDPLSANTNPSRTVTKAPATLAGKPGRAGRTDPGTGHSGRTAPTAKSLSSNPTIAEVQRLLAKINDAIQASGNLRRDIKNDVLSSTKLIEDLLLANPDSVHLAPTQADPMDTANLVRSVVREELARIRAPTPAPAPSSSFAEIARTPKVITPSGPNSAPPKSRPAIIVSSKAPVLNPAETFKTWKESITFRDTNFAPAAVKYVSNNKLRVEFDTAQQRDITLRKIEAKHDSQIRAEASKMLSPMIVLKGVPESIPTEDLTGIITGQNDSIKAAAQSESDLVFKFKRANRNKNLYNAVFIASPSVWTAVIRANKVNLDHLRIHAEEYVPVLQCYKCLQYGHTRARCTAPNPICSHCADPHHEFKTCPKRKDESEVRCHNCAQHAKESNSTTLVNHSATSLQCPRMTTMISRIRSRTQYE